ncbi:MAG: AarF/UbiB family protein [Thermaerobacter sp.]|nr:AarF/UbiB family protein [Thermaerobacter sp.]
MDSRLGRTAVVLRLALGAALRAIWLARVSGRFRDADEQRKAERALWAAEGRRLRIAAARQGGMLIKLGQFLSTRADVLPEEFTQELGELQDVVPPVSWGQVEAVLREAYGSRYVPDVFKAVSETPTASASLAQVHRGQLIDGRQVAIKVLRPGIGRSVRIDLDAVRIAVAWAVRWTSWGRRFDLMAIWQELRDVTEQELDVWGEAARAERFAQNFKDDPLVGAPRIYQDLTRPGVLVMQFVEGLKPDQITELDKAGIDRKKLAALLISSYMKQWLVDGFFHADPHPGNLFVQSDGGLIYVDFGMMGEMRPQDQEALRKLVRGIIAKNLDDAVDGLVDLGFVRPTADLAKLRRAFGFLLDRMLGTTFYRASGPEVEAFVREIRDFLYEQPFQIPARYTFLGRALGILSGIVAGLAPGDNFVRLLIDGARKYAAGTLPGAGARDVVQGVLRRALEPLQQALRLLQRLDRQEFRVPIDFEPLRKELARGRNALRSLTYVTIGGFAALSAALVGGSLPFWRDVLVAVAVVCGIIAISVQRRA